MLQYWLVDATVAVDLFKILFSVWLIHESFSQHCEPLCKFFSLIQGLGNNSVTTMTSVTVAIFQYGEEK